MKKQLLKLLFVSFVTYLLWMTPGLCYADSKGEGSLEYKSYIIRYDRGWDILCEPYEVKKNDWVLKIFKQKGEIAHENFREFLGIFERLNPHIKDIDRIRPGQHIEIPLRKLQQGALPGQATGVVTIPFVSITRVVDLLATESSEYRIQKGDTVSQILTRHFGAFGSRTYQEGVKLFKTLNPEVTNLDLIYAGQKINVPNASVRKQPWYQAIFDETGNVVDEIHPSAPVQIPSEVVKQLPLIPQPDEIQHGAEETAAAVLEAALRNKGTYYQPLADGSEFELDLSRYPILELKNGQRFLLSREATIMGQDPAQLQRLLSGIEILQLPEHPDIAGIIESVMEHQPDNGEQEGLRLLIHGVQIAIRARWIETVPSVESDTIRTICITPIQSPGERTSASIFRLLDQYNVALKEIRRDTGQPISLLADTATTTASSYPVATSISTTGQKEFVEKLAATVGYHYAPNVSITFPYAGIQVKAMSNLISTGTGQELLVDHGDLYGDAIASIKKTGLKVVQLQVDDSPDKIVEKILSGLHADYIRNPAFLAANRPSRYNTTIQVRGFLLDRPRKNQLLLATQSLHQRISEFLKERNIGVVLLGEARQYY